MKLKLTTNARMVVKHICAWFHDIGTITVTCSQAARGMIHVYHGPSGPTLSFTSSVVQRIGIPQVLGKNHWQEILFTILRNFQSLATIIHHQERNQWLALVVGEHCFIGRWECIIVMYQPLSFQYQHWHPIYRKVVGVSQWACQHQQKFIGFMNLFQLSGTTWLVRA